MMFLQLALVFLVAAGLAALVAARLGDVAVRFAGLALWGGFSAGAVLMLFQGWLDREQTAAFVSAGALTGGAGLLVAEQQARALTAFMISLAAAVPGLLLLWVVPSYGRIPPLPLITGYWHWGWAGFALMALLLAALGALGRRLQHNEGRAALAGMALALPLGAWAYLQGAYCHGWMLAAFAAACGGFYVYNRAPAALRPGFGGGLWLAFTPGLLAALSAETIGLTLWLPVLAVYAAALWRLGTTSQKNA